MLGYAAEFAFRRRLAQRASDPPAWGGSRDRSRIAGYVAVGLTVIGWAVHVGSVVTRGFAAHRVPWGNMYEFSSMVSLVAVTVFLALLTRQPVRFLGAFVMAPVVLYLGLAGTVLYADDKQLEETRVLTVTYGIRMDDTFFQNPQTAASGQ